MKLMILAVIAPFFFLSYQDHPRERPKTHCTPQKLNPKTRKLEKSCECLNNNIRLTDKEGPKINFILCQIKLIILGKQIELIANAEKNDTLGS